MAVCSMLCADGLLLHLVGKRQLLVYSGALYGNDKLGDSIWESHHKSSAQGAHRANTPPGTMTSSDQMYHPTCYSVLHRGTHLPVTASSRMINLFTKTFKTCLLGVSFYQRPSIT